jgi:cytoskeleton protein RodZ
MTIGERLREARMRAELDVADVESATKIRAKYLRALENEEFGMLPDPTLVKTFLRTYAEHLGLDPQLLLEEYRAQYEPRGESDVPLVPRTPRERERELRRGGGPPIGPGTAFVIGLVLLLVLFAVIGLSGNDDNGGGDNEPSTTSKARTPAPEQKRKRNRPAAPSTLRVRVVPAGATYVCVDDGKGPKLFEDTIDAAKTFRRRGTLRINLGRVPQRLTANGKRVPVAPSPNGAGFSISRSGAAKPLPVGQRPCA